MLCKGHGIIETYNTEFSGQKNLINVETRAWYNPNLESRWNIMLAMIATFSFLQTLVLTALFVVRVIHFSFIIDNDFIVRINGTH